MSYQITIHDPNGIDIIGLTSTLAACKVIEDCRAEGLRVTYTGDPFADFAAMLAAETEEG